MNSIKEMELEEKNKPTFTTPLDNRMEMHISHANYNNCTTCNSEKAPILLTCSNKDD